ncbi:enoyl-CoA hydratase/isomerase family protein [Nocardia pseudovaccinii]|uniref:enoyl-CoA hydratase/isomerase family protein n=1 Tax=Nocardia pseudovaccinii TaxID=189540 RepID=UPI003D926A08
MSDLSIEHDGHVAIVELRRPPHNFFHTELIATIADAAEAFQADRSTRCIVLASEGKNFCAGADLSTRPTGTNQRARSAETYRHVGRLFGIELPIIAAVQGAAVGGGLGLACVADFRVASPESRFQANFARLGFHHGFALSSSLPRIVGLQATKDLLYSGRNIRGEEAHRLGLVDRLVAAAQIREEAIGWATELAKSAPLAVRAIKATLQAAQRAEIAGVLEHELDQQTAQWDTKDFARGVEASAKRDQPVFFGD